MISMDLHTHTIASGHGTGHTVADLAKAARKKGMQVLGISDHGPATPGSCRESYFRSLKMAPDMRCGIRMLYGAEANILNEWGMLDLGEEILNGLDYCIAGIHENTYRPVYQVSSDQKKIAQNTDAYIYAMQNPYVKIIAHPDDVRFPVDALRLVEAAVKYCVILEVNEASLRPDGYRGNTRPFTGSILSLCLQYRHPILLSSDSHGAERIGEMPYSQELVREIGYPEELILNGQPLETLFLLRTVKSNTPQQATGHKV